MAITTSYIAPSQKLGNTIARVIRESLPVNNGKVYQTKLVFSNVVDYKDKKFSTNALDYSKSCRFHCMIVEGKMIKRHSYVLPIFRGEEGGVDSTYFQGEKQYSLQGWVEMDWDKSKRVDVFYEVLGNVMRDPKTAVAMLLL